MKKVLLAVAVVAFGFSFTSCKKCEDCSLIGEPAQEYCGDDLDAIKALGGTCN